MKALIIGASSGIGKDIALNLYDQGHEVILVARRINKLKKLKEKYENIQIIEMDVSSTFNCMKLHNKVKKEKIDILVNCAGMGTYGNFNKIKLDTELDMIDLNIKTTHTLTKLFLKDFIKKDAGYILNVADLKGFTPVPIMASYAATKAYIISLTNAISEELKQAHSEVYIGTLCPGNVSTEFKKNAKITKEINQIDSDYVAKYAIKQMFNNKQIIIPGTKEKVAYFLTKILPRKLKLNMIYKKM